MITALVLMTLVLVSRITAKITGKSPVQPRILLGNMLATAKRMADMLKSTFGGASPMNT